MVSNIERDSQRFKKVVRGHIKQNLRKYVSRGEMIGRQGKDLVSIPVPQVEIPHFRFGRGGAGGVGQGEGEPGTPLGPGDGEGGGAAGNQPGEHILEVELTFEELAAILGEELELPRIEPRGKRNITSHVDRYTGISRVGPESLRHFKRTYKEALKRQLISGTYDPVNPRVVPIPEDKRYRSWKTASRPESSAVIIYMMDVSGSMGDEQKEIVRLTAFWIDAWLRSQYNAIETRYIIHDAEAREVDRHTFYHTRESGGTVISSAYELCNQIIDKHYDPADWNIYPLHFSDGDNWGHDDTQQCIDLLSNELLPKSNVFCYGQVRSSYRSGEFLAHVAHAFKEEERLIATEIPDRDRILEAIKAFLGKGK
jgi:sporulation protein YhbH